MNAAPQKGRLPGRPFPKGKSGNPRGRPKENIDVKRLAREWAPDALERLRAWMASENPKASVQAAMAILDRGYGKPTQPVSGEDGGPVELVVTWDADA